MPFRILFGLLIVHFVCSCTQQPSEGEHQTENSPVLILNLKSGLKIENGPNQGIRANKSEGITSSMIYMTSIITNDSTVPIHLKLALAKEYNYPTFCEDHNTFKAVLFPKELTPDTATLHNNFDGLAGFMVNCLDNPSVLDTTLAPGEYCVVTLGIITPMPSLCESVPRAVFSHDSISLYQACDRQENPAIATELQLEIGLKVEFYNQRKFIAPEDGCSVIPFCQISYPVP